MKNNETWLDKVKKIGNHLFFRSTLTSCATLLLVFQCWSSADASDSEISWEQAAVEVEHLPFTTHYIDSLKNEYNFSIENRSLRTLSPLRIRNETLVYDVAWGPMSAGFVILSTEYCPESNTIRVGGKALSNNFVGAFYKMRDYVISTIDADGLYPIFFEQHLREGKRYKADHWMLFDNRQGKLHVKEKSFKTIEAPQFIHDYLSLLYYVRSIKTAPGDTFSLNMYTDSKVYPIFFSCKDRKVLKTESGTFNCINIEPRLAGDGRAFNKKDKLEVLISDDGNRMPILIKSKIKFGTITAKLVWYNKS